jgi:hypothetical protein
MVCYGRSSGSEMKQTGTTLSLSDLARLKEYHIHKFF